MFPQRIPTMKGPTIMMQLPEKNNLASQLYCELKQIAEEEAPSSYTARPAIQDPENDESYVIQRRSAPTAATGVPPVPTNECSHAIRR